MRKLPSVVCACFAIAVLLGLGSARADIIVDQQQLLDANSNNSGASGLAARKGQTFTPTFTGLDVVEISFSQSIANGVQEQFLVNIRQTNAAGLTGTIIGTSNTVTFPDARSQGFVRFDFASIVPLTPSTQYAMELVPIFLGAPDVFTVRVNIGNPYSGGEYYSDATTVLSTTDLTFREGLNSAVPEPSSLILAGVGAFGLALTSWRRWKQPEARNT